MDVPLDVALVLHEMMEVKEGGIEGTGRLRELRLLSWAEVWVLCQYRS